jgi:hypothetical protein
MWGNTLSDSMIETAERVQLEKSAGALNNMAADHEVEARLP